MIPTTKWNEWDAGGGNKTGGRFIFVFFYLVH